METNAAFLQYSSLTLSNWQAQNCDPLWVKIQRNLSVYEIKKDTWYPYWKLKDMCIQMFEGFPLFICLLWDSISQCILGWLGTCYVDQADLNSIEFHMFLIPKCLNEKYVPPSSMIKSLEGRWLCRVMPGDKLSSCRHTSMAQ